MANHSSAKKAIRHSASRTSINKSASSKVKTYIKKALAAIESDSTEKAREAFIEAQSKIMKAVSKKILKLNTASRKVASLAAKLKAKSLNK